MEDYIKSDILCVGGLEFRFSDSISWPCGGALQCYSTFLDRPAKRPAAESDVINVALKTGLMMEEGCPSDIMESGDGIRWSRVGAAHIVEKVLPHVSVDPLWQIRIHMAERSAEIYFSELYLASEEKDGGWPVGAPRYPMDQHMLMHFLAPRRGALIHSAGIRLADKGFICSGVSGAGKTTISRLLVESGQFEILTDDRVVARCYEDGGITMHGTPWTGEGQYATSGTAPLAAIFFLKQDKEVRASRLSVADAVARFLPVTSVPWFNSELMTLTLKSLEEIAQKIPAYDLHFTKTQETAEFIAEMAGGLPSA